LKGGFCAFKTLSPHPSITLEQNLWSIFRGYGWKCSRYLELTAWVIVTKKQITKMNQAKKLMSHQRWSTSNQNIIVESGDGRSITNSPCWSVSIDTPNYSYYVKYMELTKGVALYRLDELEDFISKNLSI
jgi:hypothetical protein